MKQQVKKVQFDLFRVFYLTTDEDGSMKEAIYDLKVMLNHIVDNPLQNTRRKIFGDNYLFHVCRQIEKSAIWEMQILHLREQVLPGIADEDGAYELIELSEDQYPAESTTVLYDEDSCMLYVQRNIYGTSVKTLTRLIELISPKDTCVALKPVMQNSDFDKVTTAKRHKRILIGVDTEELLPEHKESSLGKIISAFSEYQGRMVEVKLDFGRKKGRFLNNEKTVELVKAAYEFPGTDKLVVDIMENDDARVEKVDLLDDRRKFLVNMSYSRENPITHERLKDACLAKIRNNNN